ncbi:hypothetical protein IW150_004112 [Coemansia sp. RSA 2607]|nr:hypothetical protein IW150_004112 [Coemansia sp. RSA 2607]
MEFFSSSVESQTILLHPVDTQAAFLNVPYHFFYANSANETDFMPSEALPGVDGRIKLLNVHVVRMSDNSGVIIFVNIPHYVVDGTGFFSFVELWGTLCRAERMQDSELAKTAIARNYCFDRGIIARHLPDDRKPLDTDTLDVYTGFNPVADWLAWLSPNTRSQLLDRAKFSANIVSHTFRVSQQSLELLCEQVSKYMPGGQNPTPTHVFAALVSKTVARAHKQCDEKKLKLTMSVGGVFGLITHALKLPLRLVFGKEKYQSLNLLADMRHPLGLVDQNYMGNGLLPHNTKCPLDVLEKDTSPESLAEATAIVSSIYSNADSSLVGSFIDMISARPSCFTRPMVYLATHPKLLVITNETAFKLYKADFGNGLPEWTCTIPSFVANFVGFLPSPPPSTDIVVNITMKKQVMNYILKDEFWRSISQIVY